MAASHEHLARDGWEFEFLPPARELGAAMREQMMQHTLAALHNNTAGLIRRSRHAQTYLARIGTAGLPDKFIYIKLYERARGFQALKQKLRGNRARHVVRIAEALREAGFNIAPVLMLGERAAHGGSLVVTMRAEGMSLADALEKTTDLRRKRELLRAVGTELGRLHRAGFIHGDSTPFNYFVSPEPGRITLIDHDRTRRPLGLDRERRRLRNLVQLGRFALGGVSRADRVRVYQAYAEARGLRNPRRTLRRVAKMLAARLRRPHHGVAARTDAGRDARRVAYDPAGR